MARIVRPTSHPIACRTPAILAVALAIMACLTVPPAGQAGTWQPVGGYGLLSTSNGGIEFVTMNGYISINYDVNNLATSTIEFNAGSAGYDVVTTDISAAYYSGGPDGVTTLVGSYGPDPSPDQMITVDFYRNPGKLNASGNPLSLDALAGAGGDITVTSGYHDGIQFSGGFQDPPPGTAPEPSSFVTMAIGVIIMTIAVRRRMT